MTPAENSANIESMTVEISSAEARAEIHAALADASRVAIVDALRDSDCSPSELCTRLDISSNLMAHHLGVLEGVGLIKRLDSYGDGRRRYLRLRPGTLEDLLSSVTYRASKVLFVCTANSARSQLAAALWNHRHKVPASSAGTEPAQRVHPGAVRAARRLGLDITDAVPRSLDTFELQGPVVVVTVCDLAHEHLAGKLPQRPIHWSIADPASDGSAAAFHASARAIAERIDGLASHVVPVP